jgi:hypothetical protein
MLQNEFEEDQSGGSSRPGTPIVAGTASAGSHNLIQHGIGDILLIQVK